MDHLDDDLILYTTILYNQEDLEGDIIYEASNALSYDDRTLGTLAHDTRTYSVNLENADIGSNQEITISARMLFRSFKPQMLELFHPAAIENIPIIEMHSLNTTMVTP